MAVYFIMIMVLGISLDGIFFRIFSCMEPGAIGVFSGSLVVLVVGILVLSHEQENRKEAPKRVGEPNVPMRV